MTTKQFPNLLDKKRPTSPAKARPSKTAKSAHLRHFLPLPLGQCWPGHWPGQPGPILREPEASEWACLSPLARPGGPLGPPMSIAETAGLIGCSPWTVRQTLIPRGLPHFRFKANGRLIFYRDQVIRWIENQQGGKQ